MPVNRYLKTHDVSDCDSTFLGFVDVLTATNGCHRIAYLLKTQIADERRWSGVTYMVLFAYTEQGIRNIKDSPARVEAAKKTFQGMGGEVKDFYLVMGMDRYDTVFIVEAPDD